MEAIKRIHHITAIVGDPNENKILQRCTGFKIG